VDPEDLSPENVRLVHVKVVSELPGPKEDPKQELNINKGSIDCIKLAVVQPKEEDDNPAYPVTQT
jgi:hypothetical protein